MNVNTEKTELAIKEASTEINKFVVNAQAEVKAIEEEYGSIIPDASTRDGYKFCKEVRAKLMPIKSGLEQARKTLKAPILAAGKLVDGNLNPLSDRVADVMKPFVDAYQEVDNEKKRKEEERQNIISSGFSRLSESLTVAAGSTSTVIETVIDDLADFDFNPDVFQERTDEAVALHSEIMGKLSDMLQQAIKLEEIEAKQKEIEERERLIREKEEAEQKRIDAEAREAELSKARDEAAAKSAKDAEERHRVEIELAEARAKEQAEAAAKAERDKVEHEKRMEAEEAAKREANRKHKAAIHNEILAAMKSVGISDNDGKSFIKLVASGAAGNIKIYY